MTLVNVRNKLQMRSSIATVLCLFSTQVFAERMLLRCHGYSIDASKEPFTFAVTIDRDRSLVMDIRPSNDVATFNGSIVETTVVSETMITANDCGRLPNGV
jgi:hypothetical protein